MNEKIHSDGVCLSCGGFVDESGLAMGGEVEPMKEVGQDSEQMESAHDMHRSALADALAKRRPPKMRDEEE